MSKQSPQQQFDHSFRQCKACHNIMERIPNTSLFVCSKGCHKWAFDYELGKWWKANGNKGTKGARTMQEVKQDERENKE